MARKRGEVEPDAGQRLLENKLKLLHEGRRRRSLALDMLTGRAPGDDLPNAPGDDVVPPPGAGHDASSPASPEARPFRTRAVSRRTVYLSSDDLADIDFVIRAWRRRVQKRVSRSEVLRQAIGNLRDAVELGAVPRQRVAQREESLTDG